MNQKLKALMTDYSNALIYGKDPDPCLVGLYLLWGKGSDHELVRCIYRADGRLEETDQPFYPFLFASNKGLELIEQRLSNTYLGKKQLNGKGYYRYLVWFSSYKKYLSVIKTIRSITENTDEGVYTYIKTVGSPEAQFLMQSGKTMFKGLHLNDLHRLAFDIETYTEGFFPQSHRDPITIIAAKDNKGGNYLLHTARDGEWDEVNKVHKGEPIDVPHGIFCQSEEEMLYRFRDLINWVDPDVIEGHNIFKFDLPYVAGRMAHYGIETSFGRDKKSTLRFWDSRFRAADKTYAYHATSMKGRSIIDTYFAAMSEDVFRRNMESYGLKYLAQYYKVVSEEREYVPGNQIPQVWREEPMRLLRYALNDVEETLAIAEKLSQSSFYMTQMIPQPYDRIARAGQGSKIESLFLREYLNQSQSVPKPEFGKQDDGGYSDIIHRGVYSNVLYADVESLYPSIMLNYNVKPESDELGIFQPLLKEITNLRFDWKNKMRSFKKNTPEYTQYEGQQNAAKIVSNSFYGNLASFYFPFNDYSEGQRVAITGQKILRSIMGFIREDGGTVIECDTDGVMFLPPSNVNVGNRESELQYIQALNDRTPEGIVIGHDGTYEKMVSFKTKNYVLRETPDSEPKFKGSAIISRGNEPFINKFIKSAFRLMLDEDIEGIREMYLDLRRKLTQKKLGISEFAATNTLKKTLKEYQAGVKINGLRYAQYEIALDLAKRGMPIAPGDRITYYVALPEKERVWEMVKWDGDYSDDENVNHYLRRLDAAMNKLKPMFKTEDFKLLREVDTGSFPLNIGDIKIPKINVKTGESYESKGTEVNGQCKDAGTGKPRFRWMGCSFHGADDDLARLDRHSLNRLVSGTDLLWREGFLPGDSGEEPERNGSET